MKRLLPTLIGVLLCHFGKAQIEYHPFSTLDASWRESSGGFQCIMCCTDSEFYLAGDTVIENQTYLRIKSTSVLYESDFQGNCTSTPMLWGQDGLMGFLREDILNKKVYFRNATADTDTLLYDFELDLGDTLPAMFVNDPPSDPDLVNVVSSIDSILIGDTYRKRFGISTSWDTDYVHLIEGIGGTFGLFSQLVSPFESGSILLCYSENGQTVYPDTLYNCPSVPIPPDNVGEIDAESLLVYPNPTNESVRIEFGRLADQVVVRIFTLKGELIGEQRASSVNQLEIDLPKQANLYLLELNADNRLYHLKLIKE